MRAIKLIGILVAVVLVLSLANDDASAFTRKMTVGGVELTLIQDFYYEDGRYWQPVWAMSSKPLTHIAGRTEGKEMCNQVWQTDWDKINWQAGIQVSYVTGIGGYNTDWWDCWMGNKLQFRSWGYYRWGSGSSYHNVTFGMKWVCDLIDPWCSLSYI